MKVYKYNDIPFDVTYCKGCDMIMMAEQGDTCKYCQYYSYLDKMKEYRLNQFMRKNPFFFDGK